MNKKLLLVLGVVGFAALMGGSLWAYNTIRDAGYAPEPVPTPPPAANSPDASEPAPVIAPDFTVLDAQGNEVTLASQLGKPVVVNFWASWCPPCKAEMPHFEALYRELGDTVNFMMIDMVDGGRETSERGAAFIAEQGYTFPVYFDVNQQVAYQYGVYSLPSTLFLDADGVVVDAVMGMLTEKALRSRVEALQSLVPSETSASQPQEGSNPSWCAVPAQYAKIDAENAKTIMEDAAGRYLLLDVRTQAEYDAGHIEGATLLPHDEISQRAAELLPDKRQIILVYCRSGRRSAEAAQALVDMGYNHVYDFGGINDWPYGTVTE